MLGEILKALWQATLPVTITSFVLTWWSLQRGYVKPGNSIRLLKTELKTISKTNSSKKRKRKQRDSDGAETPEMKTDPLHRKWMKFGGGFYGVVAFQTYLVIEYNEIMDFIEQYEGVTGLFSQLGPGLLISFFVESIKNFVAAVIWPVTWLQEIPAEYLPVWLIAAWLGYRLGTHLALTSRPQTS
jgi:hypothetical protein